MHRRTLPLLVVLTVLFLALSAAPAGAAGTPPVVTFQPASSVVVEPAYTDVVATWSGGDVFNTYTVQILDVAGNVLRSCAVWQNSRCAIKAGGWQRLHSSQTSTYRARVIDDGNNGAFVSETSTSVTFQPHQWQLTMAPDAAYVAEPAKANFVTTVDSSTDSSAPYSVEIRDENEALKATCSVYGNLRCSASKGGWLKLHDPLPVNWHAVIVSGTDPVPFARADATATISPHQWTLSLTPAAKYVEVDPAVGSASTSLTIAVENLSGGSPYQIRMVDADTGAEIGAEYEVYGNPTWVKTVSADGITRPVRHYRAEIFVPGDDKPFATAAASIYFHNPNADPSTVDGFDLDLIATALTKDPQIDPCQKIRDAQDKLENERGVLETHLQRSTLSDAQLACETARTAGKSVRQQIAAALAAAGVSAGVLAEWLAHEGAAPHPPASTQPGPEPVSPPTPLDPVFDGPEADIEAQIRAKNSGETVPDATIPEIARRCVWLASDIFNGVEKDDCGSLPIFVVGREYPEATDHIIQALEWNAP